MRKLRVSKGYSIERIYLESDISRATLSHLERGLIDPRASTLRRIADTIGIKLSDLINLD
ncbi:MAG: helix-turn-helix transcriptional regulator [Bdellovibrionales bacterium]|nr:helix-turn-helix transcriptional regulator [Bdellovibrionales bacterium]